MENMETYMGNYWKQIEYIWETSGKMSETMGNHWKNKVNYGQPLEAFRKQWEFMDGNKWDMETHI